MKKNRSLFLFDEYAQIMRMLRIAVTILLIISLFTACKPPANTKLIEKDGAYYLDLMGAFIPTHSPELSGPQAVASMDFNSVHEMIQTIQYGYFAEEQWRDIYGMRIEDGCIPLFDLDNVYDVHAPDDHELKTVAWCSTYYQILFCPQNEEFGDSCEFQVLTKEGGEWRLNNWNNFENWLSENTKDGENIGVTTCDNETHFLTNQYRYIQYQIPYKNGQMYIREKIFTNYDPTKETKPWDMEVLIVQDDVYVLLMFWNYANKPASEWYSSWEIEKYEG